MKISVLLLAAILLNPPIIAAQEEEITTTTIREDSDFVVGLNALNGQIKKALDELPSRRVMVLPLPLDDGKQLRYCRLSNYIKEQLVTSLAASRNYQIINDPELLSLAKELNISPMELGNTPEFQQIVSRYKNDNIIVGTLTDLGKKVAVMARVISGSNGQYAGAAYVYIRVEEEMETLLERLPSQEKTVESSEQKLVQDADTAKKDEQSQKSRPLEEKKPITKQEDKQEKATDTEEAAAPVITKPDISGLDENSIYRQARDKMEQKKFSEAIGYFEELIKLYPDSPLADNSLYWVGECYYSLSNWSLARATFQRVLDEYPYGNKVPDSTLKRGYAEEKLGQIENAISSMEEVIRRFGDKEAAEKARQKLQILRAQKQ